MLQRVVSSFMSVLQALLFFVRQSKSGIQIGYEVILPSDAGCRQPAGWLGNAVCRNASEFFTMMSNPDFWKTLKKPHIEYKLPMNFN
jgi:hypothetical protein